MKTRIRKKGDYYYPEYRSFFIWHPITVLTRYYENLAETVYTYHTAHLATAKQAIDSKLGSAKRDLRRREREAKEKKEQTFTIYP